MAGKNFCNLITNFLPDYKIMKYFFFTRRKNENTNQEFIQTKFCRKIKVNEVYKNFNFKKEVLIFT